MAMLIDKWASGPMHTKALAWLLEKLQLLAGAYNYNAGFYFSPP